MRHLIAAAALTLLPALAQAAPEYTRQSAEGSVETVMDRLEAAVTEAGATVFARIDHAAGAREAGMALPEAQLLIFGNPKLGTPAMQADIAAGLALPLRVLVYEEAGETVILHETVETMFEGLEIPADAGFAEKMTGALDSLTAKAAE
jgi:uncharacterized protein (DUF302 family)